MTHVVNSVEVGYIETGECSDSQIWAQCTKKSVCGASKEGEGRWEAGRGLAATVSSPDLVLLIESHRGVQAKGYTLT